MMLNELYKQVKASGQRWSINGSLMINEWLMEAENDKVISNGQWMASQIEPGEMQMVNI